MSTQTAIPQPTRLTDQPTHWPLLYFLPQTHYVKRQRAANAHEYYPKPKAEVSHHKTHSKKQTPDSRPTTSAVFKDSLPPGTRPGHP
jgi:hypothetical protein